ncbi:unnamed protein product [Lathyrus sativus]|nr:unnamed protein product [Lathyrus sativus]
MKRRSYIISLEGRESIVCRLWVLVTVATPTKFNLRIEGSGLAKTERDTFYKIQMKAEQHCVFFRPPKLGLK